MHTYLLLQHPGHNRVYYNAADKLALSELTIAANTLTNSVNNIRTENIAGIRYLAIDSVEPLEQKDINVLSRLSFVFALYELQKSAGKQLLLPVKKYAYEYVDDKISSLLKYQGKTNELFTKMMLSIALLSSDFDYSGHIQLLDPVAGKGTTLFEAAVYGFNAYGIEINPKPVQEATLFFKKYLEAERYKHTADKRQVYGKNKSEAVYMQEFTYANSREAFKNRELQKQLAFVNGNTGEAANYFKSNTFHLIVGDLPYGISHGNKSAPKTGSVTRNPSELLALCLPGWHKILKKGGCIVLAWNSFVVSKTRLINLFTENGFEVQADGPYAEFEHMVDKSIKRDLIVAKKA